MVAQSGQRIATAATRILDAPCGAEERRHRRRGVRPALSVSRPTAALGQPGAAFPFLPCLPAAHAAARASGIS